jgi:hypothetical protein
VQADDDTSRNSICENDRHGLDAVHRTPVVDMPAECA